jgi:hypothetical protein
LAVGVLLLSLPCYCRAAGAAADSPSSAIGAVPDQQMSILLNKLREQIFAGHTTAPPSDNAVETWVQVAALMATHLSPGAAEALGDFVRTAHSAETTREVAGHDTVAIDLSVFADFAVAALKDRSVDYTPAPPASSPSAMALSLPGFTTPAEARTTDVASQQSLHSVGVPIAPAKPSSAAVTATTTSVTTATLIVSVPRAPGGRPEEPNSAREMSASAAAGEKSAQPSASIETAIQPPVTVLTATYVGRGDQMLAIGDVSAARKFYEYAARRGDAAAAAKLAETYDPDFLRLIGAVGLQPDVEKAAAWYRQAAALGDTPSQARLRALNQEAAR